MFYKITLIKGHRFFSDDKVQSSQNWSAGYCRPTGAEYTPNLSPAAYMSSPVSRRASALLVAENTVKIRVTALHLVNTHLKANVS